MKTAAAILFALCSAALAQEKTSERIRVACLGDSITYGAKVNPKTESYPAQLQQMLGDGFLVRNFGVGGATMIRHGQGNAFDQLPKAREFRPHIVIVSFGINDTRSRGVDYWEHSSEFLPDTRSLIEKLSAIPTAPHIVLCLPSANLANLPGMSEERRTNVGERLERLEKVRGWLREVGKQEGSRKVTIVDLEAPTVGHPEFFNADGVHLTSAGYRAIAETICPVIQQSAKSLRLAPAADR